ncbi:MAG: crosslink repair DNA glycosylase YcaQ family protein [Clostridiaceae bacterium]|nr:crosslink repair DNA glycosylase YcaQ family protein [Clostridiaceae bacterium]
MTYELSCAQARRFLLEKQGLWDEYRFYGVEGVIAFTRQAGCVQFDPVDSCGRSPDLTYLSRVGDYRKAMLETALYRRRALLDYWDKNMAILPMEEWPFLERLRAYHRVHGYSREKVDEVKDHLLEALRVRGALCARDLDYGKDTHWYWSNTTVARAALETLFFRGDLCIHHRKGGIKCYDIAERCVPAELMSVKSDGLTDEEFLCRRVLRRIGGVGLLWNRASDAWLGIGDMKAEPRKAAFAALEKAGHILPVRVEGLSDLLYALSEDQDLLERIAAWDGNGVPNRCELLAPLDSFLWDRKLIRALFDFSYTWEIYTIPEKRVYGFYVLPVLLNGRLVGRIEPVRDRKAGLLRVRGLWWEKGEKPTRSDKAALRATLHRLAAMNGLKLEPHLRLS